jgi:hydroxyacylglutathione hydrolase
MKGMIIRIFTVISLFISGCQGNGRIEVLCETTGPYEANCYLIYDKASHEAALIDPGWKLDTLTGFIRDNGLHLKYIFITHGHADHYYYVPEIKKQFPSARWCLNKDDYEKILLCDNWPLKAYGKKWIEETRKNPEESVYLDFDPRSVGKPDIFVEGGQSFRLGSLSVETVKTPGHTPGGICYYTDNMLFSGDMLFFRSVGNLDSLTSNRKEFIHSVRKIYGMFPDGTIVYPGHGKATQIGSEKTGNRRISLNGGEYDY